jgi:type I restriction enzyme S subunit
VILPRGWIIKPAKEICEKIQDGTHFSPKNQFTRGPFPYVTAKNVRPWGLDLVNLTYLKEEEHRPIYERSDTKKGDVLLVKDGVNAGDAAINTIEGEISLLSSVCFLRPQKTLRSKFLRYYLQSPQCQTELLGKLSGSAIRRIILRKIRELPVIIAPLEEQDAIISELDIQLSRLDEAVTTLQGIQAKLKQSRASILKAAVEGRLVPPIQSTKHHKNASRLDASTLLEQIKLSTEEYLGKKIKRNMDTSHSSSAVGLQPGWCLARLSDLGVFGRGKSRHRPRNDSRLFGGAYPFIQTGEVAASKGRITHHTYTYSEFGLSQSKLWPKHTLCITIAANIANTGILQIDACFPDSVVGLYCPLTQSVVKYAEIFIGSIKGKLEELAPATAQKNINLKILDDLHIPLPPLVELCQIVRAC